MAGHIYEVDVDYGDYTVEQWCCSCTPGDITAVVPSDGMGMPLAIDVDGPYDGDWACTKCGALSGDYVKPIVAFLEVGTKVAVRMARWDASKGAAIPWNIIGKVGAPVNREGYAGTIPGVRLTDAVCDDPMHDCTTHAVSMSTNVRVIMEGK